LNRSQEDAPSGWRRCLAWAALFLGILSRPGGAQSLSSPIYNPGNGHWYQAVLSGPIPWYAARANAESLFYAGYRGHLVAITSAAENDFILANVSEIELWIGAYQDRSAPDYWEPGGGWRWTTGEPFLFNHWLGEPNNVNGNEDAAVYRRQLGWNDMSTTAPARGYLVEYEPAGPYVPATDGSGANLLVNGSFEVPAAGASWTNLRDGQLPGWRITRGDVDVVGSGYWPAAPGQGSQSLDLAGGSPGTIEQTFVTVPGQEYLFSGWMSHNPVNSQVLAGRAYVTVNGQPLAQLYHPDPQISFREMRWVPFAYRFRAVAAITTLAIADQTTQYLGVGLALDGLSVTPVTPNPTPLGAPYGLAIRLVGPTQVELSWTDGSLDETGFELYRRDGAGLWTWIATVGAGTNRYADFGLRPGTTYSYRVRARNDLGVSPWSNEAVVTMLAP
jgi:hypothetical protein